MEKARQKEVLRLITLQHPCKVVAKLLSDLPNSFWLFDANQSWEEKELLRRWRGTATGFQEREKIVVCDLMAKLKVAKELGYEVGMEVSEAMDATGDLGQWHYACAGSCNVLVL